MDNSISALRQRLDAEADVLVAWLVANSTAWLPDDEQLPDELARPAQAQLAATSA